MPEVEGSPAATVAKEEKAVVVEAAASYQVANTALVEARSAAAASAPGPAKARSTSLGSAGGDGSQASVEPTLGWRDLLVRHGSKSSTQAVDCRVKSELAEC